ncbi:hypothetical protein O1611_g6808 [Lasiodiplodia mahajangana]|uniref:Uncharacterized protein n=1 Tax=Lasiodiplodia mahajangana TaxID=1108764 RepID=A0ACC2JH73_9PEZI|nr:hypothetical protein O1611_g6808 [Lasiodiplodia mahajangana]
MKELRFFEETAGNYGLDLAAVGPGERVFGPNVTTRGYIDLFDSFAAQPEQKEEESRSLFDGLVVLWATEQAYLAAWTYAKGHSPQEVADVEKDLDGGALRKHFIQNWTSRSFQDFVKEIRECLDAYAEGLTGEDNADARFATAAAMTKKVFVLEEGFWPVVGEDEDA